MCMTPRRAGEAGLLPASSPCLSCWEVSSGSATYALLHCTFFSQWLAAASEDRASAQMASPPLPAILFTWTHTEVWPAMLFVTQFLPVLAAL